MTQQQNTQHTAEMLTTEDAQSKKEIAKLGRQKLQRIIETCKSIEEHSLDPFLLDIDQNLLVIRKYFPEWKIAEDLCLDAETLHQLASVVKQQSEWVKHRSTSLYTDPFLLLDKLKTLDKKEIVRVFTQAWRPLVELEQISLHSMQEALRYWEMLTPISERWNDAKTELVEMGTATKEELVREKILRDQAFSDELEAFWRELKTRTASTENRIRYEDFVCADTFDETIQTAFMTSFLITYGYAELEIHPLEEEIFIIPNQNPAPRTVTKKQLVSVPIPISIQEWENWRKTKD